MSIEQALDQPTPAAAAPAITGDDRTWAMLAHASFALNLVTGFLGPIAALIIYLLNRDRSRYVAYHALQSAIWQMLTWYGGGILVGLTWIITGALSLAVIGLLLIPVACVVSLGIGLLPLAGGIAGVQGALATQQGQDFKYWLVGDWLRGTLTG